MSGMAWLQDWWMGYNTLVYNLGVYGLMALSVAITLSCGVLSLASATFMGLGAYAASLVSLQYPDLPFAAALSAGMALPLAVALGVGLPFLRLSGVYLAMATLGFGEVVRVVILHLDSTGGALGLNGIPERTTGWHVLGALALVLLVLGLLRASRFGRAWEALREDEVAAAVNGVPVRRMRLAAFALSGAVAGLAGGLQAHYTFSVSPGNYGFEPAVDFLCMAVLGGVGGLPGPLLGASILTVLPEVLRSLADFRTAVSGLVLITVILFLPDGLYDLARLRALWSRRRT